MLIRPRRLRKNAIIRNMVAETKLSVDMLVYPYFVVPGKNQKNLIPSMPGIHHFSIDQLLIDVEKMIAIGINKILLFGIGEEKTIDASSAYNSNSIVSNALKSLKSTFGDSLFVITDVCTCAYTTHGQCGILDKNDDVDNDKTLQVLSKMALSHAQAGADMIAPSDMMDGRIQAIRNILDENNFEHTGIMSYSVKYASGYYGPFRDAADSCPGKKDRKTYQMDFRNAREALKEAYLDEQEGADILMVKPALAYLDIIKSLKENTNLPIACYNVSGEYAMVKNASIAGLINEKEVVMENMYAFARAGSNIIITYHAPDIAQWIR